MGEFGRFEMDSQHVMAVDGVPRFRRLDVKKQTERCIAYAMQRSVVLVRD
jgi:hypothetical protein